MPRTNHAIYQTETLEQAETAYTRMLVRMADLQDTIDDYQEHGSGIPADILDELDAITELASGYGVEWGFDC